MRDLIPPRLQNAWWVHPHTGEVIPVHAHAQTVADDPEKFGLKHSDVDNSRTFNPFDRKAGSAAQDTITAANKNGWVRVRNILGRGPAFQVHGNAHEIPQVIGHLEKKGIKLRGPATVDDPGHQFTKTFSGGVEALKSAHLGNAVKVAIKGSGDAEVWHNMDDGAARDLLRARLHARAGLPMEERMLLIHRIDAFLGEAAVWLPTGPGGKGEKHPDHRKVALDALPPEKWVNGSCETWAHSFAHKHGGKPVWIDNLPGHEKLSHFVDHMVVKKDGKYHDAINHDGVADWHDLHFVKATQAGLTPDDPAFIKHKSLTS